MMLVAMFAILAIFGAGAIKYTVTGYLNKSERIKNNKFIQLLIN